MGKRGIQYASNFLLRLTKHFEWSAIRDKQIKNALRDAGNTREFIMIKRAATLGSEGKLSILARCCYPLVDELIYSTVYPLSLS